MSSPIVAVSTTTAHSPSVDATETEDTTMMKGGGDDVVTSPTTKESSSPAPNTPTTPVTTETSTDPAAGAAAASDTGTTNNNTSPTTATTVATTVAPPSAVEFEPPVACVRRILKKTLPSSSNVGKDAVAAFARASGIFIIYLTACANDFARENRRQTITANDVLAAIKVSVVVLCVL
jgi:histone H3/H4